MRRISLPIEQIRPHYSVVVTGSGYGGAIAASRMARAGQSVCLLERGREILPGDYPDTLLEAAEEFQTDTPPIHIGPATGLFDFRVNEDISVVLGCGLGGTSLINANVGLRAKPWVFEDPVWPKAFRDDTSGLAAAYAAAEAVLRPTPVPAAYPALPKMLAQQKSAAAMGAPFDRLDLYVTFEDPQGGLNPFGVPQAACIGCGDCVSGCNFHAKNTTLMNYLPDAVNFGAEIFTEVSVRSVEKEASGGWRVWYRRMGAEDDAQELFVTADIVILGAGTLGSTEILLRSKARGLPLSDRLGERFTGNGDVLGFAYNTDTEINGIGFGNHDPANRPKVGPCITSMVDLRDTPVKEEGMVIEEGSIPGAIGSLMPAALAAAAELGGNRPSGVVEALRMAERAAESLLLGAYHGATRNTQTYLIMTHDDAGGRMFLDPETDRLRISWPGAGEQPIFQKANDNLKRASQPLGGVFAPNPTWHSLQTETLITVHPMGGCVMGESAALGVVNHKGQVFSGGSGEDVYEGLYVDDGAVLPRPLGVNPSLTISAIAERTCALIAKDRGWTIDSSPRP